MELEFKSAEETRVIAKKSFEIIKKNDYRKCLDNIQKEIATSARNGEYDTTVKIKEYIEKDVVSLLESKGYRVEQEHKITQMGGVYSGNPPYTISWEDKGE
ncbi:MULTISPECIES: hypothetical protein [Mammaliicoccus]|uniref:hypothetical protein n=1 Tax=Mammaliicoccus TaxID=2803850 RepID=UPI001EFC2855|nr:MULTISPECIES: hypothetical protein [Mammaliicoccus]UXU70235.1 hypothetical protein MUA36_06000 [Mammaliicoccus sciuri]